MILSVTPNPCIDKTIFIDGLNAYSSNRVLRTETDAGGKGVNVARVAAELGQRAFATGLLGGKTGKLVAAVLDEEGVRHDFVKSRGETRINISVEDQSGNPPTTFNERGETVKQSELDKLVDIVFAKSVDAKFVSVGGSIQPGIPTTFYRQVVELGKTHGADVVVDAEGEVLKSALTAGPFLVKPNASEASKLLERNIESIQDALEAAQEINKMGAKIAIVSLGSEGAVLATENISLVSEPISVEAQSTIGAGDSMIAGYLVGQLRGMTIHDSFALGAAAGAATAMSSGSDIGRRKDIDRLFKKAIIKEI
jgi:1-phosphofructokinase family hexose kinase